MQTVDPGASSGPAESEGEAGNTGTLRDAHRLKRAPTIEGTIETVRGIRREEGEVVLAVAVEECRDQAPTVRRIPLTFTFRAMRIDPDIHRAARRADPR
jgi:hypothetical protein